MLSNEWMIVHTNLKSSKLSELPDNTLSIHVICITLCTNTCTMFFSDNMGG